MVAKWSPPFTVYTADNQANRVVLADNLNYPEAVQLRFTWREEKERQGYVFRFGYSNRAAKEGKWIECHVVDSIGKMLR